MLIKGRFLLCLVIVFFGFIRIQAQTNNFILVDEDNYNSGAQVSYVVAGSLAPFFDYPQGPPSFPNSPEGTDAIVLNFTPGLTLPALTLDKQVTICPGAAYYFKFFIGNEYTSTNTPSNGPNIIIKVVDALNNVLWTANYPNIQYAFQEITTSTFIPTTSTIRFQLYNNKANPTTGSAPNGIYVNDAVFDDVRLYQNNPFYNSSSVSVCSTGNPVDLDTYLYWTENTGTWSGPSVLPNPQGTFDPSTDLAGSYVFTNNNTGVCPDTTSTIPIVITTGPSITPSSDQDLCGGNYTLPSISGSNVPGSASYYTGSMGTGTSHAAGSNISSTTTLYAYAAIGSCTSQDTFNIVIQTPPNAGRDSTTQFCSSSGTVDLDNLIGATDAGTWQETSGTPSGHFNTSTAVLDVPNTAIGTYTFQYVVLGSGVCENDTSFVSILISNPIINAISNSTVCGSYTLPVIAGSNLSGNQAYYTGANGTGTVYHAGDVLSSTLSLYAYDVTPSDATCFSEQSFSVTVNQQMSAGTDFASSFCASYGAIDMDTLITGQDAGGTWTNTVGTSTTFDPSTATINVSTELTGTYTFQYVVLSTAPCLNDTSLATISVINPTINPISNQTVCSQDTLPIILGTDLSGNQAYYTGANGTGTIYHAGDVISSSQSLYAYDVSPTDATCSSQQSFSIAVNQQMSAGTDYTSSFCTGFGIIDLDTTISGQDAGGTWTNVSGNSATFSATPPASMNVNGEAEGTYVYEYIVNSTAPCVSDTSFATISVLATPQINMTSSTTQACEPAPISFSSGTTVNPNFNYSWAFGDGNTSTLENPTNIYNSVGCFNVSLTVSNTGGMCSVSDTQPNMVCVVASPVADFTTDQDTLTPTSSTLTGVDNSTGGTTYQWSYGDGQADTAFDLSHTYASSESGYYTVELVVSNTAGCADTTSKQIYILNKTTIVLPNIFTPNGDGSNDLFTVNIQGISHVDWTIFNRWGNVMMIDGKDTDPSEQNLLLWDGKSKGAEAAEGVYFIKLRYTDLLGKSDVLQGHLNLERN